MVIKEKSMSKRNKEFEYSENFELIKKLYSEDKNITSISKKIADIFKINHTDRLRRGISYFISENIESKQETQTRETDEYKCASERKTNKQKKNFIITYVQEHTPIHEDFFNNILAYAKHINADIHCIAGVYNNYTSKYEKIISTWDERVVPYLDANRHNLNKYICILSDVDVLPTASRPLQGFEAITGRESSIIGHPRIHFEVIPTLSTQREKYLMTTGAVTLPNYRRGRAGSKAHFHHTFGFVIVEVEDDENFIPRQVTATEDGSFMDLWFRVENGNVSEDAELEAIILGDVHVGYHDEDMLTETENTLMKCLNVKKTIAHDLFNGSSINHHSQKDFIDRVLRFRNNNWSLEVELDDNREWLEYWKKWNVYVIPSNHNDWIDKWVRTRWGKDDILNAVIFNELESVLMKDSAPKGLYAYLVDKWFDGEVATLHRDESLNVLGWELNNHGDLGSNGAKASPTTFRKLNTKIISGDKHFPYRLDGALGVGISTHKQHGYNKGLSSWVKCHVGIHSNGKAQHYIYVNNKFTTLKKK